MKGVPVNIYIPPLSYATANLSHICKLHPCHHIMCLQMCYELLNIVYHIILLARVS